jgi:hypothetical protein
MSVLSLPISAVNPLRISFTEYGLGSPTCCAPFMDHHNEQCLLVGTTLGHCVLVRPSILNQKLPAVDEPSARNKSRQGAQVAAAIHRAMSLSQSERGVFLLSLLPLFLVMG